MIDERWGETDSGWVGAGEEDDLDRQLLEEDDAFDRGQPHVVTALGPVEPGALGVTLAGEHVGRLALAAAVGEVDGRHEMLAELEDAYSSGVRAVVVESASPGELPLLHWLAGRVQPHLVLFAPPAIALSFGPDAARRTPEIGGVLLDLLPAADVLAAVMASRLPVRAAGPGVAMALLEAGLEPSRLSIPLGEGPDVPAAEFDGLDGGPTFVLPDPAESDAASWARSAFGLVAAGWGERLAISSGVVKPSQMLARGGTRGMGWTMAHLPLALMDAGLDAIAVRALFIDNPMAMLTIEPETR